MKLRPLAKIGATVAALAGIAALLAAAAHRFVPVTVCLVGTNTAPIVGHLIGQTKDKTYVGLGIHYANEAKRTRTQAAGTSKGVISSALVRSEYGSSESVLSIADTRVRRVYFGPGAVTGNQVCREAAS